MNFVDFADFSMFRFMIHQGVVKNVKTQLGMAT